jgi:hypothetical protein
VGEDPDPPYRRGDHRGLVAEQPASSLVTQAPRELDRDGPGERAIAANGRSRSPSSTRRRIRTFPALLVDRSRRFAPALRELGYGVKIVAGLNPSP